MLQSSLRACFYIELILPECYAHPHSYAQANQLRRMAGAVAGHEERVRLSIPTWTWNWHMEGLYDQISYGMSETIAFMYAMETNF